MLTRVWRAAVHACRVDRACDRHQLPSASVSESPQARRRTPSRCLRNRTAAPLSSFLLWVRRFLDTSTGRKVTATLLDTSSSAALAPAWSCLITFETLGSLSLTSIGATQAGVGEEEKIALDVGGAQR